MREIAKVCSHYEPPTPSQVAQAFGVDLYEKGQIDLWPGYTGPFIRRPIHADLQDEASPQFEVLNGSFGLIPSWSKDNKKIVRHTYNARSETVAEKPSFRNAWRRAQHCIIPAAAIYEPDWRTDKAIPTRITRADREPMGIAGLWERWQDPSSGEVLHSYTMLTLNADDHEFMRNYHRPGDEKRMVVILPRGLYKDWLDAPTAGSMEFMRQYPADRLMVG